MTSLLQPPHPSQSCQYFFCYNQRCSKGTVPPPKATLYAILRQYPAGWSSIPKDYMTVLGGASLLIKTNCPSWGNARYVCWGNVQEPPLNIIEWNVLLWHCSSWKVREFAMRQLFIQPYQHQGTDARDWHAKILEQRRSLLACVPLRTSCNRLSHFTRYSWRESSLFISGGGGYVNQFGGGWTNTK